MSRRETVMILILLLVAFVHNAVSAPLQLDPDAVLDKEKMRPKGQRYEAIVPNTLDLAERAKLSINALTGKCGAGKVLWCLSGFQVCHQSPPTTRADLEYHAQECAYASHAKGDVWQ